MGSLTNVKGVTWTKVDVAQTSAACGVEAQGGVWMFWLFFFFFLNRIHPGVGTTAPSESHLWEHDSSSHPILNSLRFGLKLWFVSQKIPWIRGLISCYSLEGEHLLGPEFLLASWLFSNQSIVLVILELLLIPGLEDNSFSLILGI